MEFIIKPRGYGKTTDIVRLAYLNNGSILVATEQQKKFLKEKIPNILGCEADIQVFSISNLNNGTIPRGERLYLDEVDSILQILLNKYNLAAGTLTL